MKSILLILAICSGTLCSYARTYDKNNIVQCLIEESDSTINIDLSPSLKKDFLPEIVSQSAVQPEQLTVKPKVTEYGNERKVKKTPTRTNGYRIQIFSDGRNQQTLQSRARARAKQILARFPKYNHQVYSFSKAPNYYTRIGNFATRQEAEKALNELRRAFPDLAGEMRIVSGEVVIMK